jgi:hypothetical protein
VATPKNHNNGAASMDDQIYSTLITVALEHMPAFGLGALGGGSLWFLVTKRFIIPAYIEQKDIILREKEADLVMFERQMAEVNERLDRVEASKNVASFSHHKERETMNIDILRRMEEMQHQMIIMTKSIDALVMLLQQKNSVSPLNS